MPDLLPTGTITLLFTDMEGSTRLLQQLGESYASVLADCRHLLRLAFAQHNGHEVDTQGDAFFVSFARATDALAAAAVIQRTLAAHPWPQDVSVRVRIGLHTGEPQLSSEGYIGVDVHHAARIMSAGHGGQILLSPTTRQLVEQHLPEGTYLDDLGEHRLKDLQRPTHLFQLSLSGLATDFPPLKTLDTSPNNLPIQPTPFIGREKEVTTVGQLLRRPDVLLVTLTGPGGVGKTRLGLQVAAELTDLFADGVFLVALAPVNMPTQVVSAIAQTLGIGEASDQPLFPLLQASLKEKQLLLLLDNFEQVADAAVILAELLTACPKLKVLVTSRMGLHVRAEHEFIVPPLSLPNPKRLPDLVTLSQYEAVALFIQRSQAVKPDFQVTNANAPAVAAICARLDGLPLAIELAAARSKFFAPQALLTRLEQGLALLTGGARDLPARQQTLHAAIAWSYNLLAHHEQQLFRRLSVFVDGCTWEAAEVVCQATSTLAGDVFDSLLSLVDKSLLRQEESTHGEPRFWMLQMLREFGLECLASAAETEVTRQVHTLHFLALAEEAEHHLRSAQQGLWLARLEQEHENLRAALNWLLEHARMGEGTEEGQRQAEQTLRLCVALEPFWYVRGYSREGLSFLDQALATHEAVGAAVKARALHAAAELAASLDDLERTEILCTESLTLFHNLADKAGMGDCLELLGMNDWGRGQYALARSRLEEAATLYQQMGESWKQGRCFTQLARIATVQGQYDQAHGLLEQSLTLYRALGDKERLGWVLYLLARLLFLSQRDAAQARSLTEQSLAFLQEIDNPWERAYTLVLLGQITLQQGKQEQAYALFEESVGCFKEVGDQIGTADALMGLASVVALQGELVAACALYQESLALARETDYKEGIPSGLEGLAIVVAEQGELPWAVRLWGTAEVLREAIGTPLPPVYRTSYQQAVANARTQLGEETFTKHWSQGRALTPQQALTNQNIDEQQQHIL